MVGQSPPEAKMKSMFVRGVCKIPGWVGDKGYRNSMFLLADWLS